MTSHRKHRGAESEMVACAWLLANGYEVFRNVSQHGDVDIVGWKDGSFHNFDVKTLGERHILTALSAAQMARGVKIVAVNPDDNSCRLMEPAVWSEHSCEHCRQPFKLRVRGQRFCTSSCKQDYHNRLRPPGHARLRRGVA